MHTESKRGTVEETEKKSIYAADNRATVREELEKLEVLCKETIGLHQLSKERRLRGGLASRSEN